MYIIKTKYYNIYWSFNLHTCRSVVFSLPVMDLNFLYSMVAYEFIAEIKPWM